MSNSQRSAPFSAEEMRQDIIAEVSKMDTSFLRVVHSMMRTYAKEREIIEDDAIIDYTIEGSPIHKKAFLDAADEGIEKIINGRGIPAEDFFQKKEKWMKNIE